MRRRIALKVHGYKIGHKALFMLTVILIAALTIDTSIVKIAPYTGGLTSPIADVAIFVTLFLTVAAIQFIILRFVKNINQQNKLRERLRLGQIHQSMSVILYILTGTLITISLQMVSTSNYSLILVESTVLVSYVSGLCVLGILSVKLFFWFKYNVGGLTFVYLLAISTIFINGTFAVLYVITQLNDVYQTRSAVIQPLMSFVGNYNTSYDALNNWYETSYPICFGVTWIATVLMLLNYSRKLGRARFWVLTTIPVVFFMSQFSYVALGMFTEFRLMYPISFGVIYTLFFSGTVPAAGILFGLAFLNIARTIPNNNIKQYMMISGFGMMILFSANQVSGLVRVFYPPFGLVTLESFGLASYLLLIGIYTSAVSVAEDSNLRQSIRECAVREANLLNSIGIAQMQQQIRKRVTTIIKQNQTMMSDRSGIESSISEEDIKQYLDEVISELKKASPDRSTDIPEGI
jgi:hypothetical protein